MTTEDLRRKSSSDSRARRSKNRGTFRLAIVIAALAPQIYLFLHFWLYYSKDATPSLGDYLVPIAITLFITLAAVVLGTYTIMSEGSKPNTDADQIASSAANPSPGKQTATASRSASGSQRPGVLHIVRSCERLTSVEDELIMRVSTKIIDRPTGHLMAQMQICTSRIMQQLKELDETPS